MQAKRGLHNGASGPGLTRADSRSYVAI